MVDRNPHRGRPPRWLRRSMGAAVLAGVLSIAQSASAGTTGGSATAQAASVALAFAFPPIELVGNTQILAVGPTGSQTVPGSVDLADAASSSSLVATSTSIAVARTPSGVGSTSSVDGLQLTLRGTSVASVTSIVAGANCPAGDSAVTSDAQANGVRLGDAAPVDVSSGQSVSGSTTITDDRGQAEPVELAASVFADSDASSGAARGLRLTVTIGNQTPESAELALGCQRPDGGAAAPEPMGPDGGLADSGTDTAVAAGLLGVVFVVGGGSVLLWAHGPRSRRADRR